MISGQFGSRGELLFEIDLIAADEERFTVEALLDTGFIDWSAINIQDAESLGWTLIEPERAMQTAKGEEFFDLYVGKILLDGQEFTIPVYAGENISEILMGLQWLQQRRLVVDVLKRVLTLENS